MLLQRRATCTRATSRWSQPPGEHISQVIMYTWDFPFPPTPDWALSWILTCGITLLAPCRQEADIVVVSIYVNPTQVSSA